MNNEFIPFCNGFEVSDKCFKLVSDKSRRSSLIAVCGGFILHTELEKLCEEFWDIYKKHKIVWPKCPEKVLNHFRLCDDNKDDNEV